MPIFVSAIADGKVYAFNNEHSPNSPLYNGYNIYCINATSGEEIYKMLSWSGQTGGTGTSHSSPSRRLTSLLQLLRQPTLLHKQRCNTNNSVSSKLSSSIWPKRSNRRTVIDISSGTTQTEQACASPTESHALPMQVCLHGWNTSTWTKHAQPTSQVSPLQST